MMNKSYLVTRNVAYNFIGQIILLLLGVITAPFIIHTLGTDVYGIFSLVTAVVGYFSVLDLGLGVAIIKYISEYEAKKERAILEKVIGTALTAYILIGFIGSGLILIFTRFLVTHFLHIPLALIPLALSVFYISSIGFFVNMVLTVFNAIPNALQRMDILNSRNVLFGILNTAGVLGLLALKQGLLMIVIWNILVSILATIIFLRIVLDLLPGYSIGLKFDKAIFRQFLKFGGFKFVLNISGQVVFQLDRLLIGIFLPISAVSFYTVPNLLVQKSFTLTSNITSAVFPALSSSYALGDSDRIKYLYLRMTKFIVFLMFPLMLLLFIFSNTILLLWLDQNFARQGSLILKTLAGAYFIAALSAPGVIASDAFGKPQLPAIFSIISAIINLISALILIPRLGIEGAALAMLINFIAQVPVFLSIVNQGIIQVSNIQVVTSSMIKPICAGILAAVLSLYICGFIGNKIIYLVLGVVIFSLAYLVINYIIGTFDRQDKLVVWYFARKVLNKF